MIVRCKKVYSILLVIPMAVCAILLSGCAGHQPRTSLVTETYSVKGSVQSIAKLLTLFDVDKMNREVASLAGSKPKYIKFDLLEGWDFRNKYAGSACDTNTNNGCYYLGEISLYSDVNNMFGYYIYHELGHHYFGRSEEKARAVARHLIWNR
jgi:hypothetical protein